MYSISNTKFYTVLRIYIFLFLAFAQIASSCGSDDEEMPQEERRVITDVEFTLGTSGGNPEVVMKYSDPDGVGGNDPIITGGTLVANAIYFGSLELSNAISNPPIDVDEEINLAKEDHQFFFTISGIDLTINYADADGDGNPIGLFSALQTKGPGSGSITISLQRGLNKFGTGVKEGMIANAGGTTDIQVNFPIEIQ